MLFIQLIFLTNESIAQAVDSTAIDSILLKQIEEQRQGSSQAASTHTRSGLSFNPDLGLIGDFRAAYISSGERNIDTYLKETELSIQSVVDPYIRADFFLSLSRNSETHQYGIEVEEGYLTTLSLPWRLQLRAGKFKQAVGRESVVRYPSSTSIPY